MSHLFEDWTRVQAKSSSQQGVIVWDPTVDEYRVLWDDNGWDSYLPGEIRDVVEKV